ncbi:AMP-binding protein [Mycolicibacterium septicum]|uniref:AMP-binding protein n=1 Tax=Mycolicibacterium septicum TaxID=98668 RepID=UPI0009FD3F55|nr:AMP-binding protein [Mycolicibacterium septicum]
METDAVNAGIELSWTRAASEVLSVPDALDRASLAHSHREYLRFPHLGISLSFSETQERSSQLAHWLRAHGVEPGDRVAVMLDNVPAWPLSWYAILRNRACVVPVNPRYRHSDIGHVLKDSGARLVLTSKERIGLVEDAVSASAPNCQVVDVAAALAAAEGLDVTALGDLPKAKRDDLANLQYTSGTTGFPKACMLTHDFWLRTGAVVGESAGVDRNDVSIMAQAWSYVDQQWMTTMCVLSGTPHVVLERFSASGFWPAIRANAATVTYVLGAMPVLLYKQPATTSDNENRMRVVLCSAIPKDLHRQLEQRWSTPWREVYGSTETGVDLIAGIDDTDTVGSGALGRPPAGKKGFRR